MAEKNGIVIITDSDSAGRLIRNHLQSFIPIEYIKNVYLPQIEGKEKRKAHASGEGFLGVEGTDDAVILAALEKFGVFGQRVNEQRRKITKQDLYELGLSGGNDSAQKRESILKALSLPIMSANAFVDVINALFGYDDFLEVLEKWEQEQTKKQSFYI